MRKMWKMFWENWLIFLDFIFMVVTLVATAFVPELIYGIYAGYFFMILDIRLLVEERNLAKSQVLTLFLGLVLAAVGHKIDSVFFLYGAEIVCLLLWLVQYIYYLKYLEKAKT